MKKANTYIILGVVENIVTLLVTALLFWWTDSGWVFLLLLNINSIKTNPPAPQGKKKEI